MLKFLQELAKLNKPEQNLRDETIASVKKIATEAKLQVSDYPNGCLVRSPNDESAAVQVQFGGRRDFYESIEVLGKETVDYRVIVTSSKVKSMKIGEIKWVLNNKYQTKDKWLILDIEHAESPKTVNFMLYGGTGAEGHIGAEAGPAGQTGHGEREKEPRRKKIFGKRGEHKEQD